MDTGKVLRLRGKYIKSGERVNIDFSVDRLYRSVSVYIILFFTLLLTLKRLYASPIICWVPKELNRYSKFINKYCWIRGTYRANPSYEEENGPFRMENTDKQLIQYYQWTFLFLFFQALLFYTPYIIWAYSSNKLIGFELNNLVDASKKLGQFSSNHNRILKYMSHFLISRKSIRKLGVIEPYKFNKRSRLCYLYLSIKLLYIFIAVSQLLMMNLFLTGGWDDSYGTSLIGDILNGQGDLAASNQTDSLVFPKLAICEMSIRDRDSSSPLTVSTQLHFYSFSCVLAFNLFNQKIFSFLWLWIYVALIPIGIIDFIKWCIRLASVSSKNSFIRARILMAGKKSDRDVEQEFIMFYMDDDLMFLVRLIESNGSVLESIKLFEYIWDSYEDAKRAYLFDK